MNVREEARGLCRELADLKTKLEALAERLPDPPAAMVNGDLPMDPECSLLGALEVCADQLNVGVDGLERVLSEGATIPNLFLTDPSYTIQVVETSEAVHCAVCRSPFIAAGPTGFQDERPLCDLCMLHREGQLGMALALIAVTRSYGSASPASFSLEVANKSELMAFAQIYETFASSFAPARPVNLESLWPASCGAGQ